MDRPTKIILIAGAVAAGLVTWRSAWVVSSKRAERVGKSNAENLVEFFDVAARTYKYDNGSYPAGDLPSVLAALGGKNPRGVAYIVIPKEQFNADGIPLDDWKTPFRLTHGPDGKVPQLISAGGDRTFGTPDDVVSSRK